MILMKTRLEVDEDDLDLYLLKFQMGFFKIMFLAAL